MDYENYKIHKVREIHCLEYTPANLKLSNDNKNRYGDPNFFQFYFNFTNFIGYNPNNLTIKIIIKIIQMRKFSMTFLTMVVIIRQLFPYQIPIKTIKIRHHLITLSEIDKILKKTTKFDSQK